MSVIGYRLSVIGYRVSVIGYRLSVIGYRVSGVGCRVSARIWRRRLAKPSSRDGGTTAGLRRNLEHVRRSHPGERGRGAGSGVCRFGAQAHQYMSGAGGLRRYPRSARPRLRGCAASLDCGVQHRFQLATESCSCRIRTCAAMRRVTPLQFEKIPAAPLRNTAAQASIQLSTLSETHGAGTFHDCCTGDLWHV